jgi:hypothetical protein
MWGPSLGDVTTDELCEQAQSFKIIGNDCYKGKKFAKAVDCYTQAILLDSSDYTFFANRAASFLEWGISAMDIEIANRSTKTPVLTQSLNAFEMGRCFSNCVYDCKLALRIAGEQTAETSRLEKIKNRMAKAEKIIIDRSKRGHHRHSDGDSLPASLQSMHNTEAASEAGVDFDRVMLIGQYAAERLLGGAKKTCDFIDFIETKPMDADTKPVVRSKQAAKKHEAAIARRTESLAALEKATELFISERMPLLPPPSTEEGEDADAGASKTEPEEGGAKFGKHECYLSVALAFLGVERQWELMRWVVMIAPSDKEQRIQFFELCEAFRETMFAQEAKEQADRVAVERAAADADGSNKENKDANDDKAGGCETCCEEDGEAGGEAVRKEPALAAASMPIIPEPIALHFLLRGQGDGGGADESIRGFNPAAVGTGGIPIRLKLEALLTLSELIEDEEKRHPGVGVNTPFFAELVGCGLDRTLMELVVAYGTVGNAPLADARKRLSPAEAEAVANAEIEAEERGHVAELALMLLNNILGLLQDTDKGYVPPAIRPVRGNKGGKGGGAHNKGGKGGGGHDTGSTQNGKSGVVTSSTHVKSVLELETLRMLSEFGRAMATKVQPLLVSMLDEAHQQGAQQGYLQSDPDLVRIFYPDVLRKRRAELREALATHVQPVLAEKRQLLLRPGVTLLRTVEALQMRHREQPEFATLVLYAEVLRQHQLLGTIGLFDHKLRVGASTSSVAAAAEEEEEVVVEEEEEEEDLLVEDGDDESGSIAAFRPPKIHTAVAGANGEAEAKSGVTSGVELASICSDDGGEGLVQLFAHDIPSAMRAHTMLYMQMCARPVNMFTQEGKGKGKGGQEQSGQDGKSGGKDGGRSEGGQQQQQQLQHLHQQLPSGPGFIGATSFEGPKPGYVFTQGAQGQGYYRDQSASSSGSSGSSGSRRDRGKETPGTTAVRDAEAEKAASAASTNARGRWAKLLKLLPPGDCAHLREQLKGSTPAEADDMLLRAEALLLPKQDATGDTIFLGMDTGDAPSGS